MTDIPQTETELNIPFPVGDVAEMAMNITNAASALVEQTSIHNEDLDQDIPTMTFEEAVLVINGALTHISATIDASMTAFQIGLDAPIEEPTND